MTFGCCVGYAVGFVGGMCVVRGLLTGCSMGFGLICYYCWLVGFLVLFKTGDGFCAFGCLCCVVVCCLVWVLIWCGLL